MPYRISHVDESTFEAVLPLIADYQNFYGCAPDDARNRAFFGDLLADPAQGLQLLASDDETGQAVGFATLYWVRVSTRATVVALLNDLYVRPGHRGNQVGAALLRAAADAAGERGYGSLVWETAPDNHRARTLYDRFLQDAGEPGASSTWIHYSHTINARPKGEK
ncbi:GNAT family N-acetyltransferase [Streptomyces sp. CB03238]|uniref:GNAT family N-acetyltransferase n=1 Tax=Streptomyces sp. CB03238 TaxID=1907777 RepID=UPI000A113A2D|nr:GNAT family N-acetyltransferase [Streptomyces sp. CB03238]ORT60673.1 GNAT family N-acetyltransferase [Streptomyces sp. CB03238]